MSLSLHDQMYLSGVSCGYEAFDGVLFQLYVAHLRAAHVFSKRHRLNFIIVQE